MVFKVDCGTIFLSLYRIPIDLEILLQTYLMCLSNFNALSRITPRKVTEDLNTSEKLSIYTGCELSILRLVNSIHEVLRLLMESLFATDQV